MKFFDRLLTIVITATLTSAVWIVFGSSFVEEAKGDETEAAASAEPVPPTPSQTPDPAPSAAATTKPTPDPALLSRSAAAKTVLSIPVTGVIAEDLVDSFFDPRGAGGVRRHEAIDIMAPKGTLVSAAAPGRIAKIHRSDAGGRSVYIRSLDKETLYFYAHLDAYADNLKEGARVDAGEALGTVGASGNAAPDTPHLHFAVFQTTKDAEWWEPANAVNPYPLLTQPIR